MPIPESESLESEPEPDPRLYVTILALLPLEMVTTQKLEPPAPLAERPL